jgi:hypothetical protein
MILHIMYRSPWQYAKLRAKKRRGQKYQHLCG